MTTTLETTTVQISTIQPPADLCSGNNFRFIPDPSACYRYFYCLLNVPLPGECAKDRVFDPRLKGCVLGDRETCTPNRNIINVIVRS